MLERSDGPAATRSVAMEKARPKWLVPVGVALLAAAVAAVWFWGRSQGELEERPPLLATQLTSDLGVENQPTFSPDGSQVAYVVGSTYSGATDIYHRVIGAGAPRRLTADPKMDVTPAWSPDGRHIAFIRADPAGSLSADVMLIPALGGPERKVGETFFIPLFTVFGGGIAWSPDGRWLVIGPELGQMADELSPPLTLLSVETGERRPLTSPPEGSEDLGPAFSPDGRALAFTRSSTNANIELYVLPLGENYSPEGEARRLTSASGNSITTQPAFTGDGSEIVFSSGPVGLYRLWRVPASGVAQAKPVLGAGADGVYPALSRDGRRLAYAKRTLQINIWRRELLVNGDVGPPQRVISSTGMDYGGEYSPNGEKIAFVSNRTGNLGIWVSRADGSAAQLLTEWVDAFSRPNWSPDGTRIAFNSNKDGQSAVYVMDAGGGAPKRLANAVFSATWSSDGEWIYHGQEAPSVVRQADCNLS